MTGSATFARGADAASVARARLDATAAAAARVESAQRELLASLVELWPKLGVVGGGGDVGEEVAAGLHALLRAGGAPVGAPGRAVPPSR